MKAAFVVFDRMTSLDFIGFYDPVTRLKSMKIMEDFEWRICARTRDLGLHLVQRLAGAEARDRVAAQMDYPYRWN